MSKKIVVVDDEPDMLEIVRIQLEKSGYTVFTTATGDEGLQMIEEAHPDLVLLDIVLENENGFDVCQKIKSKNPNQIVVIYTAKIDAADARKAIEVGADDLTLKGESMSGIVSAIDDKLKD